MMYHFVIATKVRIFIFQCIKTMRTGGYNFFNTIPIQHLDILVSHHLEHEFISCTPGRVAGTHFFFTKYGVADAKLIEYGNKCPGDLLCPLIKTPGTAHPE